MKQMPTKLQKKGAFISVIPEIHYNESLIHLLKLMDDHAICFVTLNRPAVSLEKAFAYFNVPTNKMFFIDAVSGGIGRAQDKDNVLYVSSPEAFTELSIAVSEILRTGKFDTLVFDSLSTLLIYSGSEYRAERFAASVIEKTKSTASLGIFTCLESDMQSNLIKRSCMHVDDTFMMDGKWSTQRIVRGSSALALLFGAVFVGALIQGSGITGASVALPSIALSPFAGLILVAALVPAAAALYLTYQHRHFREVPEHTLRRFTAARVNARQLRKKYRKKITAWVSKALHLF